MALQSFGRLVVLTLSAVLLSLSLPGAASAAGYAAAAETRCDAGVVRGDAIRQGENIRVNVRSDAGTPQGTVTVRLGDATESIALQDGSASFTVPSSLAPGRYDFTMSFQPADGSDFKSCRSAVGGISVAAAGAGAGGGDNAAGSLGNTGGFPLPLLLAGLLAIASGAALMVRARRRA